MLSLPQRQDLVSQTVGILRSEIAGGNWRQRLPSERQLISLLKISRPTLRLALQQLQQENLVAPVARLGYRIISRRRTAGKQELRTVHLLSPDPLERLRHQSQFWIAELRQALLRDGRELLVHHGAHFARSGAVRALPKLVAQNAPGVWLLAHSTRAIQAWFEEKKVPTVIAGYPHHDIQLPSVCIDVEAACRHAVGTLVRLGHRRIAFFHEKTDRAGDLVSERGFERGVTVAACPELRARIVHYPSKHPDVITAALRRLFYEKPWPTALIIGTALDYATASTHLLRSGYRVPQDVSLICREEDNFLPYLLPRPACYVYSPTWFAKRIYEHLQRLLSGQLTTVNPVRVVPDYQAGESVARARD